MIELVSTASPDADQEPLCSIDGDVLSMPTRIPASITLKYMKMVRVKGQEAALGWAVEKVIGEENYDRLMEFDSMTTEQLQAIMRVVQDKLMGAAGQSPK